MQIKISEETAKEIYDQIIEDFTIVDFTAKEVVYDETIIGAIMRGMLEYSSEDKKIVQTLLVPLESGDISGDRAIKVLHYTEKIKAYNRKVLMQENNPMEIAIKTVSLLSHQPEKLIGKMESADWQVAQAVASLFL